MKTILKICYIGAFLFAFKSHAQLKHANYLTSTEYSEIKINGVSWDSIPMDNIYTHYDMNDIIHQMEKLFGKNRFSITKGTEPSLYIDFSDGAVFFRFKDKGDTVNNYGLVNLVIRENTWNIRIKGTTLTIGDPIGRLGKIKTYIYKPRNALHGTKVAFFTCEQCDEDITIYFDSDDRIKEIEYIVYD